MKEPVHSQTTDMPASGLRRLFAKILREFRRFTSKRLRWHFGKPLHRRRKRIKPHSRIPPEKLRQLYSTSPAHHLPDNFVIYRIIGNDLVPRHAKGQSRANVAFILEHEPVFEACEKRWIVNRIVDPVEEAAIISLLEKFHQPYLRIPFDDDEYRQLHWDTDGLPSPEWIFSKAYERLDPGGKQFVQLHLRRHKTLYAMNNNGARNTALADGRSRAKWVLPLDGNCYFTAEGFASLRQKIEAAPWYPYVILAMARIVDNTQLLTPGFTPAADEEPQIVFRSDAGDCFDESIPYGRRPKVELLWRLGVPGPWDKYKFYTWDEPRPPYSAQAGHFQEVGWVARLASGRPDLEVGRTGFINRGAVRGDSIVSTLDRIDARILADRTDREGLTYYDRGRICDMASAEPGLFADLINKAEHTAEFVTQSIKQNTTPPSSDDPRAPHARALLADATILTLAGTAAKRQDFLDQATLLIRTGFIKPATRMNPHLQDAQVSSGIGIMDFNGLYYFMDAVRLLCDARALTTEELDGFRSWLTQYLTWLTTSPTGKIECRSTNHHGTFYDVQLLSIALFLGDFHTAAAVGNGVWLRFSCQFAPDGSMPDELKRTKPRENASLGLIAWTSLARLMSVCGENLWGYSDSKGRSLEKAAAWLSDAWSDPDWTTDELKEIPTDALDPLWQDCRNHFPELAAKHPFPASSRSSVLHSDLGHAPFWMICQP